jgi:hypothetical protein
MKKLSYNSRLSSANKKSFLCCKKMQQFVQYSRDGENWSEKKKILNDALKN